MQNRWNGGCWQDACCSQGFVPVNGNWDFSMDGGCQRQNRSGSCKTAETACQSNRQAERTSCQKNTCTGRADCTCETCTRRRDAACKPCQKNTCTGRADCTCETCTRRRESECGACAAKQRNTCAGQADNRGVGIVWAKKQALDDTYGCGRALKAGTLYPELHKPLSGYCPCDEDCGDTCQQIAFAMWELRLYLNTHPCDQEALAMLHKLQENCCEPNYATTFLEDVPCTDGTRNPAWRWKNDPWPWEYEANCGC